MSATTAISILGVVMFLAYELVLRRRRDADTATWKAEDGDRGSTRLILGAYLTVIAINIAFASASVANVPPTWRWAGIALLAAGLAVRPGSIATLGRYYTRTLRTLDDQT